MNPCRDLLAFSQNRIDADDVFRALVRYDHWLAPVPVLQQHYGRQHFDRVVMYSHVADFPPREVWLFTDDDAADRAKRAGCNLGAYATQNHGVDLFGNLNLGWEFIRVNPVSPAEYTWTFSRETFEVLLHWVNCIRFEAELHAWTQGTPIDYNSLSRYHQFIAFLFPNKSIVTLPYQHDLANPAVVVTAPDCARELSKQLPANILQEVQQVITNGRELLELLPEQGVDGLIVNPAGPGPRCPIPIPTRPRT